MTDPNRWQPLAARAHDLARTGSRSTNGVQQAVGPHWGHVTPFAHRRRRCRRACPIDPGPPPRLGDPDGPRPTRTRPCEVIRDSSLLDAADGETIDISPASRGSNPLGTNDGTGTRSTRRPASRTPPTSSTRATSPRALTEFWADGPKSETPPGHWNVIANAVSDDARRRTCGSAATGADVDRLEWDVKLYLALNGAVHDAAIAAWGLKGHYDSVRPDLDDPLHGRPRAVERSGAAVVRREGPAAGARPDRASSRRDRRRRAAPRRARRPRGRDRHPRLGRQPEGPEDADERRDVDPRVDLGPLPAAHVRDAVVPGLRLRPQHVQPRGGRGHDGVHRQRVLPRRPRRVDDRSRARSRSRRARRRRSRSSGRRTTTPPTRPASRGCTAASTSRPTTSTAARSARSAARTRGRSRSSTTPERSA